MKNARQQTYRAANRPRYRAYARAWWHRNKEAAELARALHIPIAEARKMIAAIPPKREAENVRQRG